MPFKSKAQARWAYATKQPFATRWEDKTKGGIKSLPKKVKPMARKKRKNPLAKQEKAYGNRGLDLKLKKGALHKQLGVAKGKKIPASKLAIKKGDSALTKKRKQFAINAKRWKH